MDQTPLGGSLEFRETCPCSWQHFLLSVLYLWRFYYAFSVSSAWLYGSWIFTITKEGKRHFFKVPGAESVLKKKNKNKALGISVRPWDDPSPSLGLVRGQALEVEYNSCCVESGEWAGEDVMTPLSSPSCVWVSYQHMCLSRPDPPFFLPFSVHALSLCLMPPHAPTPVTLCREKVLGFYDLDPCMVFCGAGEKRNDEWEAEKCRPGGSDKGHKVILTVLPHSFHFLLSFTILVLSTYSACDPLSPVINASALQPYGLWLQLHSACCHTRQSTVASILHMETPAEYSRAALNLTSLHVYT